MKWKHMFIIMAAALLLIVFSKEFKHNPEEPELFSNDSLPEYQSPTNLIMLVQKGSVNDSIEDFFDNAYLDDEVLEEFFKLSEYPIDVFETGIMNTMGTRYRMITDFSVIGEDIDGDRAVVRHMVTYDGNTTITDRSYFLFRNGKWYFDLIREIRGE